MLTDPIRVGEDYLYAAGLPRHAHGLRYRVVEFTKDARTRQDQVLYVGLEGSDAGVSHICTLWDFAVRFVPAPKADE